ncbi:hypothetical protein DAPPUDRAFT_115590 [Daphnia pulex]|uniref:Uncharacterized protein n=1 Tax=Daphnia pulex TaxID=6669 RepID=E9HLX4_DAPPU|nr:hypothetical protein DAPPUDRAFT_115590 [Daphnia pulex]|eukprot:EFX67252.1 hypothetical protein DAPPUDRAFT_115590 [Daphnia pulex]
MEFVCLDIICVSHLLEEACVAGLSIDSPKPGHFQPPPPVAQWALEACKAKQRGIRYKITGCHTRNQNIVTNNLSRRDAEKHLNDARNLLGDLERIHDRIIELVDDDDVAATQNTQHLAYASTVDAASALVKNYLLQRQDDNSSVVPETEAQAAIRRALQAAEQRVREARAEVEAAEQAFMDLGGDFSALGETELGPPDSVSQAG